MAKDATGHTIYSVAGEGTVRYKFITDVLTVLDLRGPMPTKKLIKALDDLGCKHFENPNEITRNWRISAKLSQELYSSKPRLARDKATKNWYPAGISYGEALRQSAKHDEELDDEIPSKRGKVVPRVITAMENTGPAISQVDKVSKRTRKRVDVDVTTMEELRERLAMGTQQFSVALGYTRTSYHDMIERNNIPYVAYLAAQTLVQQNTEEDTNERTYLLKVNAKGARLIHIDNAIGTMNINGKSYSLYPD